MCSSDPVMTSSRYVYDDFGAAAGSNNFAILLLTVTPLTILGSPVLAGLETASLGLRLMLSADGSMRSLFSLSFSYVNFVDRVVIGQWTVVLWHHFQ